jgi:predicted ATPase
MFLARLQLRRFKSLDKLDLNLSEPITLLYGPNGIGKSSVLEVASLLGHIHHLPQAILRNGRFHIESQQTNPSAIKLVERMNETNGNKQTLIDWFSTATEGGIAVFTVCDPDINANTPFDFYIFIDRDHDAAANAAAPSLTTLLSTKCTDQELAAVVAVVYDASTAGALRSIVDLVAASWAPRKSPFRLITYVNTDLNDFGRGNDLRESPKDLVKDYVSEIQDRLEIPFNPDGRLRDIDELNRILKRVLMFPPIYVPGMSSEYAAFALADCRIDPVSKQITFSAERLVSKRDYTSLDFMSAGENECVFVFTLLLGLPLSRGIVLLDEPDLHINSYQKYTFFAELYKQLEKLNCQALIATHSEYALAGFPNVDYRIVRPIAEECDGMAIMSLIADSSIDLRLSHSKMLFVRAVVSLLHVGPFSRRLVRVLWKDLRLLAGQVTFWISLIAFVLFSAMVLLSNFSDAWLVLLGQQFSKHDEIAKIAVRGAISSFVVLLAYVVWAVTQSWFARRKQRGLIKRWLSEKRKRHQR